MTRPSIRHSAQLAAYNAKDIDALLAAYAADAEEFTLHEERLAKGHEEMRVLTASFVMCENRLG